MTTLLTALFLVLLTLGVIAMFVYLVSAALVAWTAIREER